MKYLSREVEKLIRKEAPDLLPSIGSKMEKIINHWSGRTLVVLLTFIIFFTGHYINIECLNFIHIDESSIKPMIESRTTNIVAIISISFAIVGFLISNLAIKGNKSYSILFLRSFFLPITFFSLALICSFIILTALKDHFESGTLARILYLGIFLMLVDIALIGFLFTRLILFTDSRTLYKMVCKDLQEESKGRIREYVIKIKSQEIVSRVLEAAIPWADYLEMPNRTKETFIKDIALDKLQAILRKYEGHSDTRIYHNHIYLNKNIQNDKIMFHCEKENSHLSAELESTVKLTHSINTTSSETREYVKNELFKLIVANDYRSVEQILSEYSNIINISYFDVVLIDEFINDIDELISKSILENSKESFKKIDEFIYRILVIALKKQDKILYIRLLGLVYNYYRTSSDLINNTAELGCQLSISKISLLIEGTEWYVMNQNNSDEIELLNLFAYWGYTYLGDILHYCICKQDYNRFTINYQCLEGIKSGRGYDCYGDLPYTLDNIATNEEKKIILLKREIGFYHLACTIGVKYWLYWLYYNGRITSEVLTKYLDYVVIDAYYPVPLFWEMELLVSRLNTPSIMDYFHWGAWGNADNKDGVVLSLVSPLEWIILGYAIELVRMNGFPISVDVDLSLWNVNSTSKKNLFLMLKSKLRDVENSIGKWRELFNNQQMTVEIVREHLEQMEKVMNEQQLKEIAIADIDVSKVKTFIDQMHKAWSYEGVDDNSFGIYEFIDFTSNILIVNERLPKKTSQICKQKNGKVFFINGKNNVGINESIIQFFISDIREKFKTDLLRIIQKKRARTIDKNWSNISKELESNDVNRMIITTPFLARELSERFGDLNIKISNNPILCNKIIVANIAEAFEIKVAKDVDENLLRIEVVEITQEKATKLFNDNPDYWKESGTYSDQEAIYNIMNGIEIHIEINWDLVIKEPSAYSVYYLRKKE